MDQKRALDLIYSEVLQEDRENFTQIFRDRVEQVVKWIMGEKEKLIFCSDCESFIKVGECRNGYDIDKTTPSLCKDGAFK